MFYQAFAVGIAVALSFWSTVVDRYHDFRGVPPPAPTEYEAPTITLASPATTSAPFEEIIGTLLPTATSTPASTSVARAPVGPVVPQPAPIPFTPLPVPTIPVPVEPVVTPPVVVEPTPIVPAVVTPSLSDEELLRAAVVNIVCIQGGGLRGSSGSGIIIDSRGIILTVAHVGQQLLLRDYPTKDTGTCTIRSGSPAKNAYTAELIYISPEWLDGNEATFLSKRPMGTGENDFAFLAITGSTSGGAAPSSFPYIPLAPAGTDIDEGDTVGTVSYAAEFLSSSEVRSSLYPTIKFADIDDVYTFGRNTIDIFSVSAGSAAQEGSSGGGVINNNDRVIGVITTRTVKADLSQRTLQALTMDHIRRSFRDDTGANLDSYLKDGLPFLISRFEPTATELLDDLTEAINDARN